MRGRYHDRDSSSARLSWFLILVWTPPLEMWKHIAAVYLIATLFPSARLALFSLFMLSPHPTLPHHAAPQCACPLRVMWQLLGLSTTPPSPLLVLFRIRVFAPQLSHMSWYISSPVGTNSGLSLASRLLSPSGGPHVRSLRRSSLMGVISSLSDLLDKMGIRQKLAVATWKPQKVPL